LKNEEPGPIFDRSGARGDVRLLNLAGDFPAVARAVRTIRAHTALLDGEIVASDPKGQPSFQALQNRASRRHGWHIVYYAFDLLSLEGKDLKGLPLEQRKEKLKSLVQGSSVRLSEELPGSLKEIVPVLKAAGLEGILAKRRDSIYMARTRTLAWQKFKLSLSQEFVIGGYNPDGNTFSSLLLGYYEKGQLKFAGKVRQGFNPLAMKRCRFVNLPLSKTEVRDPIKNASPGISLSCRAIGRGWLRRRGDVGPDYSLMRSLPR
jgi:bifunctional non-homologous end joining protein LigD